MKRRKQKTVNYGSKPTDIKITYYNCYFCNKAVDPYQGVQKELELVSLETSPEDFFYVHEACSIKFMMSGEKSPFFNEWAEEDARQESDD